MQFCEQHPEIVVPFDRFWKGEETDRPVLFLTAPRDDPQPVPPPELARPEDRIRPEHMVAQARHRLARTAHFAEGYLHFFPNFGPGILHGCIGGEPDFSSPNTVWFPPYLNDIAQFPGLRFQPEGRWWRAIVACTEALLEEVGDQVVVSVTDLGGCADILASAVGTEQLLFDVVERPETVRAAVDHCHRMWMEAYELNYAAIARAQDVSTPWWPVVSRGRTYMTQCDFNCMISPAVFADLFAGELERIYLALDQGAFHLDGIGTERHVPTLVGLENLRAIQWVPEPGTSPLAHRDMLRGIQEAGVSITFALPPEEVEAACREFDPRRLMLNVSCDSEQQARQLVEDCLRWCEKRPR